MGVGICVGVGTNAGVAVDAGVGVDVGGDVGVGVAVGSGWVQAISSPTPTSTMVSRRSSIGRILAAGARAD